MTSKTNSTMSRTGKLTEPEGACLRTLTCSQTALDSPKGETMEDRIFRWRSLYHTGEMPTWIIERVEMIRDWSWGDRQWR